MTDDRRGQVKRLFEAASALDSDHRRAFLDVLDADLRKEVESLLTVEDDRFFFKKVPPAWTP